MGFVLSLTNLGCFGNGDEQGENFLLKLSETGLQVQNRTRVKCFPLEEGWLESAFPALAVLVPLEQLSLNSAFKWRGALAGAC